MAFESHYRDYSDGQSESSGDSLSEITQKYLRASNVASII